MRLFVDRKDKAAGSARRYVLLAALVVCCALPAMVQAYSDEATLDLGYNPNGVFIFDGSYVMNVGNAQVNITNYGIIGSRYSNPSQMSDAPSCQWPAGSGNEYLWVANLWVGGVVLGERLCSSGQEWLPLDELEATIYEGVGTKLLRPLGNPDASGRRKPMPSDDDDGDGRVDEEILNGKDDDDDGLIDEDFGQIGNQMFQFTNYDNTRLASESFPQHTPMNLESVQTSFQWENDQVDDFVGFEYNITNVGVTTVERVYIGFFADCDIGPRGINTASDDLGGSFSGMVRASDGSFVPLQIGYMYDYAEQQRVDGYFGIVFLGHDVDPTGQRAPTKVGMRTFQIFSGNQAFDQGGDPTNDDERYQLLSYGKDDSEPWDTNTPIERPDDYRFLVSAGPFERLSAGENLTFQVAMVVGSGLEGLKRNCAEAFLTYHGIYVDEITNATPLDGSADFNPGEYGRESLLCREDFVDPGSVNNPWDDFVPDFSDDSCVDEEWLREQPTISSQDNLKFEYTDPSDGTTKICAMFNLDACFECARQVGHECTAEGREIESQSWKCNLTDGAPSDYAGCTGIDGLETQINWLVGMAPPPPGMRLWATDSKVHVFWDDRSEITPDIRLQEIDFESYRIWRADNWDRPYGSSLENGPESGLWALIAEYDMVNDFVVDHGPLDPNNPNSPHDLDTLSLGANTGLEVVTYRPRCLDNMEFLGLAEAMQEIVDNDVEGKLTYRPNVRFSNGQVDPRYQALIPWEYAPDVLDTFFAVTPRALADDVVEKHGTRYYEYVDRDIHNGFIYFYSVTATDHELMPSDNEAGIGSDTPVGPGLVGDPGSSFSNTVPGTDAQTAEDRAQSGTNIYVFPNPATRKALEEYQQLFANGDDPTGVRVTFTNLPQANNTVQIYTVSGDLVQTIYHDGTTGTGHVSWNLMSRNKQEIVSGVYLYTVQADDDRFEDFIGKFVVVR